MCLKLEDSITKTNRTVIPPGISQGTRDKDKCSQSKSDPSTRHNPDVELLQASKFWENQAMPTLRKQLVSK